MDWAGTLAKWGLVALGAWCNCGMGTAPTCWSGCVGTGVLCVFHPAEYKGEELSSFRKLLNQLGSEMATSTALIVLSFCFMNCMRRSGAYVETSEAKMSGVLATCE